MCMSLRGEGRQVCILVTRRGKECLKKVCTCGKGNTKEKVNKGGRAYISEVCVFQCEG